MNARVTVKGFGNLIARRYAGPFWIRRKWLTKTQWLSRPELENIQLKLLKRLVRHCYESVPYYKRLMNERNIKPDSIKSLPDIELFPILTKKDVLDAGYSMVSNKYPRFLIRTACTGGTTGMPLKLYRDLLSIGNEHAFVRRQWDWAGVHLNDRCTYLKGRVIAEPGSKTKRLYVYDPIMKELHLSTYHLSPETAKEYARIIKNYKVKAIVGYPSSVCILAAACLDKGIDLKLDSALITSETLVESQRAIVAQAFGCKVFDFYGAAERVCYIHTCEHGSRHIIPEYGLTELVPSDSYEDGSCKIIATGFWNMAMPLIRYDTGDLLVPSDNCCSCGRTFPTVNYIRGRQGDVIRTPAGRVLGTSIVTHLVYVVCGASNIMESRVIQDALDHITIEYVPTREMSGKELGDFQKRLAHHFGDEIKVELKRVEKVARTSSGKIKPIVSTIA